MKLSVHRKHFTNGRHDSFAGRIILYQVQASGNGLFKAIFTLAEVPQNESYSDQIPVQ